MLESAIARSKRTIYWSGIRKYRNENQRVRRLPQIQDSKSEGATETTFHDSTLQVPKSGSRSFPIEERKFSHHNRPLFQILRGRRVSEQHHNEHNYLQTEAALHQKRKTRGFSCRQRTTVWYQWVDQTGEVVGIQVEAVITRKTTVQRDGEVQHQICKEHPKKVRCKQKRFLGSSAGVPEHTIKGDWIQSSRDNVWLTHPTQPTYFEETTYATGKSEN